MFSVGYGSKEREDRLRVLSQEDPTTAVILAAVHFEWMLKRSILKLGSTPTQALRKELENVYRLEDTGTKRGYKSIWRSEIEPRFKGAALGTVLGRLAAIQHVALKCRGRIVHGNGTVSRKQAKEAVELFLDAGLKLRAFAEKGGENLDARLTVRRRARKSL